MRLVTMQILQEETGIPMTIISNSFQVQPNKNTLALHDMKVTIKQVFFRNISDLVSKTMYLS